MTRPWASGTGAAGAACTKSNKVAAIGVQPKLDSSSSRESDAATTISPSITSCRCRAAALTDHGTRLGLATNAKTAMATASP
jgi:hypothetical protein